MVNKQSQNVADIVPNVTWPPSLRKTPTRQAWFERLASLPPGISINEAAAQLRQPRKSVYFWAELLQFKLAGIKRYQGRRELPEWAATADWTLPDEQIAKLTGSSRSTVMFARVRARKPASTWTPGTELPVYLSGLKKPRRFTVADIVELAARYKISEASVRSHIHKSHHSHRTFAAPLGKCKLGAAQRDAGGDLGHEVDEHRGGAIQIKSRQSAVGATGRSRPSLSCCGSDGTAESGGSRKAGEAYITLFRAKRASCREHHVSDVGEIGLSADGDPKLRVFGM